MRFWTWLLAFALLLSTVAACNGAITASDTIVLPEGDAAQGREAFVTLECTACHTIRNLELAAPEEFGPVTIGLGGNVSKVKSYEELVTSIINPSHRLARNPFKQKIERDGQSVMPIYNDVMTVTQLVDLVAFLQGQYAVIERPGYRYPVYDYRD